MMKGMKIASYKHVIILILFFVLSVALYIVFITSPFFKIFADWSRDNLFIYLPILLIIKIVSIVYPPIPGGLFTLGSVPIIGWQPAFIVDFIGSITGASLAYYLGKKYGYDLLSKLFDKGTIDKIKTVKVKKHREIESVFVMRILSGGLIVEALCYGAGLVNIRYRSFLIGFLLSHLLIGLPAFMLFDTVMASINLKSIIVNIMWIFIFVFILRKLRGRYFE